jgi:hypothetical protein
MSFQNHNERREAAEAAKKAMLEKFKQKAPAPVDPKVAEELAAAATAKEEKRVEAEKRRRERVELEKLERKRSWRSWSASWRLRPRRRLNASAWRAKAPTPPSAWRARKPRPPNAVRRKLKQPKSASTKRKLAATS